MSKKKKNKRKTPLGLKILGIFMMLLMLASPIIAVLSYVIK